MRVLIVPDKFKGTLTAKQVASAIASGWRRVRPDDELELLPMSDGGDGFGEVMSGLLGAKARSVRTVDAAHRPCRARFWWEPLRRTAIIEAAQVIGLAMLPPSRFHPFELDTGGLGEVLKAAARLRPRRCFIGIGGSATNDGGLGLARSLGWRFVTRQGDDIAAWPNLASCRQIIPPSHRLELGRLIVALDVENPLLGATGCTQVYGPQKGLHRKDFRKAESALQRLSEVVERQHSKSLHLTGGAGSSGGLGFGLMAFLGAKAVAGSSLFAREAQLDARIRTADLVITGEGCLDQQSLMGKGVGALLGLCLRRPVPCAAICGALQVPQSSLNRFSQTWSLSSLATRQQALSRPRFWLSRVAAKMAEELPNELSQKPPPKPVD